jgi:hypothetical protein
MLGLPFSEGKIIPQNMEPTEILINAVGNPTVWRNGNARNCSEKFHKTQKSSEFRFEPFQRREQCSEFSGEISAEEKNTVISFRTTKQKKELLETHSET